VKNLASEASNQLFQIKQGREITEIIVGQKFKNGTFEAAIWTKKLQPGECQPADEVCKKLGYRMAGMTSYIWGYLQAP